MKKSQKAQQNCSKEKSHADIDNAIKWIKMTIKVCKMMKNKM